MGRIDRLGGQNIWKSIDGESRYSDHQPGINHWASIAENIDDLRGDYFDSVGDTFAKADKAREYGRMFWLTYGLAWFFGDVVFDGGAWLLSALKNTFIDIPLHAVAGFFSWAFGDNN